MYEYLGNLPTVEQIAELLLKCNAIHNQKCETKEERKFKKVDRGKDIKAIKFWKWLRNN